MSDGGCAKPKRTTAARVVEGECLRSRPESHGLCRVGRTGQGRQRLLLWKKTGLRGGKSQINWQNVLTQLWLCRSPSPGVTSSAPTTTRTAGRVMIGPSSSPSFSLFCCPRPGEQCIGPPQMGAAHFPIFPNAHDLIPGWRQHHPFPGAYPLRDVLGMEYGNTGRSPWFLYVHRWIHHYYYCSHLFGTVGCAREGRSASGCTLTTMSQPKAA